MNEPMKRYEKETGKKAKVRVVTQHESKRYGWGYEKSHLYFSNDFVKFALEENNKLKAENATLRAQLTPIPVTERLPNKDQEVLAHYKSRYGRETTVRAEYFRKHQEEMDCDECEAEYDEETDTYYCPEGWYELIENWCDYSSVRIVEGAVDSWLPIPKM